MNKIRLVFVNNFHNFGQIRGGQASLTLVIILASDVEAALDAEGADPDEGVRSWGAQGVILVTGVIVPKKDGG